MADHPSTHWAVKMVATGGSDLNLAEKMSLEAYEGSHLLKVGAVARISQIEILNRETGEKGTFTFAGVGAGFGAGILSVDVADKWHPFDTKKPITLDFFSGHAATLYNMSAGLGFNWAPISGIRFAGLDIVYSSAWQSFWNGNGISFGGFTTLNAGTGLDVSETLGLLKPGDREQGDANIIDHLDEINQSCIDHGLPPVPTTGVINQSTPDQTQSIAPTSMNFGTIGDRYVAWNQGDGGAANLATGEIAGLGLASFDGGASDNSTVSESSGEMIVGGVPFDNGDFNGLNVTSWDGVGDFGVSADASVADNFGAGDIGVGGDFGVVDSGGTADLGSGMADLGNPVSDDGGMIASTGAADYGFTGDIGSAGDPGGGYSGDV